MRRIQAIAHYGSVGEHGAVEMATFKMLNSNNIGRGGAGGWVWPAMAVSLAVLSACSGAGGQSSAGAGKNAPGGASGPAEIGFIVAAPSSVSRSVQLSGRTTAAQISEVRPQISGLIQRRLFTEGAYVHAGQTLYEIDASTYHAASAEARANLASAQAAAQAAKARADRYEPLAGAQALSEQDYTDALAQSRQAQAAVAQSRARLDAAQINLRFTRVPAPISGRIGRSLFTQGALVTANQPDPLAVIQQLDPIFVDIQQSSSDMLALRRALAKDGAVPAAAQVRLTLEDGIDYGLTGKLEFSEVTVDAATGTVTLRARFPNPQGLLLPGMFVRAQLTQGTQASAFLIPQQAVTRDARGNASVLIVGANNIAETRSIVATSTQGANWVVTSGLAPGDKIIVEGLLRARPGKPVKPVPAGSPQTISAPTPGAAATKRAG
ncbi:MAG: efflux RND transporter periplasmic adaptor subunit [Sphingomonas sp.]|jgi:membrane fusion protein (multidrug efflux system)